MTMLEFSLHLPPHRPKILREWLARQLFPDNGHESSPSACPLAGFLGPEFTPAGRADRAIYDLAGSRRLEQRAAVTLVAILRGRLIEDYGRRLRIFGSVSLSHPAKHRNGPGCAGAAEQNNGSARQYVGHGHLLLFAAPLNRGVLSLALTRIKVAKPKLYWRNVYQPFYIEGLRLCLHTFTVSPISSA